MDAGPQPVRSCKAARASTGFGRSISFSVAGRPRSATGREQTSLTSVHRLTFRSSAMGGLRTLVTRGSMPPMSRFLTVVALLASFSVAGPAAGLPPTAYSVGGDQLCANWLSPSASDVERREAEAWILGYWTGRYAQTDQIARAGFKAEPSMRHPAILETEKAAISVGRIGKSEVLDLVRDTCPLGRTVKDAARFAYEGAVMRQALALRAAARRKP